MAVPDPKYLPKAKGKKKAVKAVKAAQPAAFPKAARLPEVKPLKKKSPFGDKHVWAN
ncbi:hypothetical protein HGA34_05165 [Candidatus Falkowbacteria bacterium]|nr:hypothetical protein [Candidatus Falkowbacteria bacterium]